MSGLALDANPLTLQAFLRPGLAENWARHSATPQSHGQSTLGPNRNLLGAPLSIREVAQLLGCSAWTVRQRHVPAGLPYFRSGPNSKLVFFHDQVIAWIFQQQTKGGRK
jgi:hypothetical protein